MRSGTNLLSLTRKKTVQSTRGRTDSPLPDNRERITQAASEKKAIEVGGACVSLKMRQETEQN